MSNDRIHNIARPFNYSLLISKPQDTRLAMCYHHWNGLRLVTHFEDFKAPAWLREDREHASITLGKCRLALKTASLGNESLEHLEKSMTSFDPIEVDANKLAHA